MEFVSLLSLLLLPLVVVVVGSEAIIFGDTKVVLLLDVENFRKLENVPRLRGCGCGCCCSCSCSCCNCVLFSDENETVAPLVRCTVSAALWIRFQ